MRVTIITNSPSGGGAERSMNLLANSLQFSGIETSIFPLTYGESDLVECIAHEVKPIFYHSRSLSTVIKGIFKFRAQILELDTDIVLLNCDLPEFLGCFLPRKIGTIIVEHARHPWGGRRILGVAVRLVHFFRRSKYVVVSNHLRIWPIQSTYSAFIPNMVSDLVISSSEIFCSDVKRLVFIGRLSKLKRPNMFIDIVHLSGLPGLIIGDGVMGEDLRVQSSRLQADINFLGQKKNPWEYLLPGDLVIIPSLSEGDGLVVLESLLHGYPILVSDIVDFQRFRLPADLLCAKVEDFAERILNVNTGQMPIILKKDVISNIFSSREKQKISHQWINFLKSQIQQ